MKVCFEKIVPAPRSGQMTKRQIVSLVAALKKSETDKVNCGKRLIAFYEDLGTD